MPRRTPIVSSRPIVPDAPRDAEPAAPDESPPDTGPDPFAIIDAPKAAPASGQPCAVCGTVRTAAGPCPVDGSLP